MTSVQIPSFLLRLIERARCILFVGAGVSHEAGLPTASQLGEKLANESGYPRTFPHSLLDISQYYETKFGRAFLMNKLRELFYESVVPSKTHRLIATLSDKFPLILTTNYDSLLEKAMEGIERKHYRVTEVRDLTDAPIGGRIPTILKIHGDLEAKNVILTRDDYYRYFYETLKSTLGALIQAKLATGTFLFVGYSLRDYNFVALFESVRKELESYMPKGFAVMPSPDPVESRIWGKRGVEVIDTTAQRFFEQVARFSTEKYHRQGRVAQDKCRFDVAERSYRKSLAIFKELNDKAGGARSLHQLGILAQVRNLYQQAEHYYQKSLAIFDELNDKAGGARNLFQLATLAQDTGRYEEAEAYYEKSLEISVQEQNKAVLARTVHNLGILAQRSGKYEEAEDYYQRSLEIEEKLGNKSGMAQSLHNLGILAQDRGKYEEAEMYYRRSLEIEEALGNRSGRAQSFGQLGTLAQHKGKYEEAEMYYQRSLEMFRELGNKAVVARTMDNLGILAQHKGKYEEAEMYLQNSLKIKDELGDKIGISVTRGALAQLKLSLWEKHRKEKYLKESLKGFLYAFGILYEIDDARVQVAVKNLLDVREKIGREKFESLCRAVNPGAFALLQKAIETPNQ